MASGVIEEINSGGLTIRTEADLKAGSQLRVSFKLPGDQHLTELGVEVGSTERLAAGSFLSRCSYKDVSRSSFGHILAWIAREGT